MEQNDNKRNFFRLKLYDTPITVTYNLKFGEEETEGLIRDISGNGISFYVNRKVGIDTTEPLKLSFIIEKQTFTVKASIVRKFEEEGKNVYACQYVGLKQTEESKISSILFRLDARRKK